MSYILDALRRADSERDRGSVPGLHAQPVPVSSAGALRERASIAPWIAAAAALLVVAVLGWRLLERDAPRSEAVTVAAAPATSPAAPTSLPPAQTSMPAPSATTAPVQALPAMPTSVPPHALRRTAPTMDRPLSSAADPATESAVARAPAPPATTSKGLIYNRTELPPELQRQLPNLQVGGATFSRDAASRMLIINGQIFHEGDTLAPDLTLDQIELKAAVFRFKGYRYRMTF